MKLQPPTCIYAFCFYSFCWIGLGTPFIWMKSISPERNIFIQIGEYCITLTILIVFVLASISNLKHLGKYLKVNIFLLCFLGYISVSLLWAPVSNIEKIVLLSTVLICCTAAFSALPSLGWRNTWLVVMISLTGYLLVTALCSQLEIYPAPRQLVFAYGIAFINGFVILLLFLARPRFKLGFVTVPIIAILFICTAVVLLSPSIFSGFKELAGDHFRLTIGLFLNPNLLSRLLQTLFIATLITIISFSDWSSKKSISVFFVALFALLLCGSALAEHRAANGRLVMAVVLCLFMAGCSLKILIVRCSGQRGVILKRVFATGLLLAFFTTVLWSVQNSDQIVSRYSYFLVRDDVWSRHELWSAALSLLDFKQLVFGVGLDGFWIGEAKLSNLDSLLRNRPHSHSGYVDLVLQTGFLSVALLFLATVRSLVSSNKDCESGFSKNLTMLLALGGFATMNIFESVSLPISSATILPFSLFIFTLLYGDSRPLPKG